MEQRLLGLETRMEQRMVSLENRIEGRLSRLEEQVDRQFFWIVGLIIVSILVPIALQFLPVP